MSNPSNYILLGDDTLEADLTPAAIGTGGMLAYGIDDDPIPLSKVRSWFNRPVVHLETYGGYVQDLGSDLACLFHAVLKAIDPGYQASSSSHAVYRHQAAVSVKQAIAASLYLDTCESELFRAEEELVVRYAWNLDTSRQRAFLNRTAHLSPSATRAELESYLIDPRQAIVSPDQYGGSTDAPSQYLWAPEIRQLPLTSLLFRTAVLQGPEHDLRESQFNSVGAMNDFFGLLSVETLIDNLTTLQTNGLTMIQLLADVCNCNIYLLDTQGAPFTERAYVLPAHNIPIDSYPLEEIHTTYRSADRLWDSDGLINTQLPNICIIYQPGHYETVGVVHQIEGHPQIETVFGHHNPFLVALRAERTRALEAARAQRQSRSSTPTLHPTPVRRLVRRTVTPSPATSTQTTTALRRRFDPSTPRT